MHHDTFDAYRGKEGEGGENKTSEISTFKQQGFKI